MMKRIYPLFFLGLSIAISYGLDPPYNHHWSLIVHNGSGDCVRPDCDGYILRQVVPITASGPEGYSFITWAKYDGHGWIAGLFSPNTTFRVGFSNSEIAAVYGEIESWFPVIEGNETLDTFVLPQKATEGTTPVRIPHRVRVTIDIEDSEEYEEVFQYVRVKLGWFPTPAAQGVWGSDELVEYWDAPTGGNQLPNNASLRTTLFSHQGDGVFEATVYYSGIWEPKEVPEGETYVPPAADTGFELVARGGNYNAVVATTQNRLVSLNIELEGTTELNETTEGGFVQINADNDNNSPYIENTHNSIPGTRDFDTNPIANENDLKLVTIDIGSTALPGTFLLKINNGADRIKIWDSPTKENKFIFTNNQKDYTATDIPHALYIEGIENSDHLMDTKLSLEYIPIDTVICDDSIMMTITPVIIDFSITGGVIGMANGNGPNSLIFQTHGFQNLPYGANYYAKINNKDGNGDLYFIQNCTGFSGTLAYRNTVSPYNSEDLHVVLNNGNVNFPILDAQGANSINDTFWDIGFKSTPLSNGEIELTGGDSPGYAAPAKVQGNQGGQSVVLELDNNHTDYNFILYLIYKFDDNSIFTIGNNNWYVHFYLNFLGNDPSTGNPLSSMSQGAGIGSGSFVRNHDSPVINGDIVNNLPMNFIP